MTTLTRITIPYKMVQLYEKVKYKKDLQNIMNKNYLKRPLLIVCKRQKFNHHVGQTYHDFSPQSLASGAWKHRRSTGDYFTILPHGKNPSLNSSVFNFKEFCLHPKIISALESMQIKNPTNIQSLSIPTLMSGKSVLCIAETGSGKTLSYLLPIFEMILKREYIYTESASIAVTEENKKGNNDFEERATISKEEWNKIGIQLNQPIAMILLPSRELAQQVFNVCKRIGDLTNVSVDLKFGGSGTQGILRKNELKKVDILIATPGILGKLLSNKFYNLNGLRWLVLDETDTLLDDSFDHIINNIINNLKFSNESMLGEMIQLILVGATMPRNLKQKLNQIIPMDELETLKTEFLHRLQPHISHKFIRISASQTPQHLVTFLKSLKSDAVVIVFCNKPETVCFLGHILSANSISSIALHADMPQKVRDGRFNNFTSGSANILICTDIASRGLDTIHAEYVINFEFPHFMSDYVHRSGRVGRIGSPKVCNVISYITKPWHVELLWQIEISARKNVELHNVNANIKRKLKSLKIEENIE